MGGKIGVCVQESGILYGYLLSTYIRFLSSLLVTPTIFQRGGSV